MARADQTTQAAAVGALARRLGLAAAAPVLLGVGHHHRFLLPAAGLVARVRSSGSPEEAERRARRELAVVGALHARGAPVPPVADASLAGPHREGGAVVTLWPFHRHDRTAGEEDADVAAETLAAAHRVLAAAALPLPPFTDMLDRCRRVLTDGTALAALAPADRRLLLAQGTRLRRRVEDAAHVPVPLQCDAHPGNLLMGGDGPAWIDWEEACLGPVEWDVATLPPSAWPLFPEADPALVAACADLRSVCVAVWCWADPGRSPAMREAAVHHLGRVRAMA